MDPSSTLTSAEPDPVSLSRLRAELSELRSSQAGGVVARAVRLAKLDQCLHEATQARASEQPRQRSRQLLGLFGELDEWRAECRNLGLEQARSEASQLIERLLDGVEDAWRESVANQLALPDADACFQALLRTTTLQHEARRYRDPSTRETDSFAEPRGRLRQALADELAARPVSRALRQRWGTALSDLADLTLTSIDDLPPEVAAEQLACVADDLAWHLRHVEHVRGRSWWWPVGKSREALALQRRLARLRAEQQERELQFRLERRFGPKWVSFSERLVLALIVLVVIMMTCEWLLNPSPNVVAILNVIDAAACAVFLTEFFVKLGMVQGRLFWFRRHFLIDLIPSIPIGLLASGLAASSHLDAVRAGRLARFLRLPRLARYIRVLRPGLRVARAIGLSVRGVDRLARRYGRMLNRNVILYPTREELDQYDAQQDDWMPAARLLQVELRETWRELLQDVSARAETAAARQAVLQQRVQGLLDLGVPVPQMHAGEGREIPARVLLEQLQAVTPQSVEATLGMELVTHLARIVRILAPPPLRWLPIISHCVPRINSDMSDAEVVAQAARNTSGWLKWYHDAWFWVADLYGTVTPSQFVDRVGGMLVKSSFRPAYRLALFGGVLLLIELVLRFTRFDTLQWIGQFLQKYVGTTVLILGSFCFLTLALGWWLQRLAQEATEFCERAANASFLSLTEMIRSRHLGRDARILYRRVLRPEWLRVEGHDSVEAQARRMDQLGERIRQSLLQAHLDGSESSFPPLENLVLLYRDWLDGALLTSTDTRTVSQLLANPSLSQLVQQSGRVSRKQVKALSILDLERQKSLLGGPYLWFNFISRSIAHSVALLLVDYNRHAVPLEDLPRIGPHEQAAYQRWVRQATQDAAPSGEAVRQKAENATNYVTSAFTALHFLDFDPQRDLEVERRFGRPVRERLELDRSLLIRRIFGTFPRQERPRDERVVNLFRVYEEWLAGGRVILLPVFLAWRAARYLGMGILNLAQAVQEVRKPNRRGNRLDAAQADFRTAVRKIGRVRDPIVLASLRLRMFADPEYLGICLPGTEETSLADADVDRDLDFLRPEPRVLQWVEDQRQRAAADMRRLEKLLEQGLLARLARLLDLEAEAFETPEHRRAAAVAYLADLQGVRSHLSAADILSEVFQAADSQPLWSERLAPHPLLHHRFRRYWRRHRGSRAERRAAWRATLQDRDGVRAALVAWCRHGSNCSAEGEQRLARILLHPGRVSEQLITLRAVQTFAVLDVLNYREHVYHLGRYDETSDSVRQLLTWMP